MNAKTEAASLTPLSGGFTRQLADSWREGATRNFQGN